MFASYLTLAGHVSFPFSSLYLYLVPVAVIKNTLMKAMEKRFGSQLKSYTVHYSGENKVADQTNLGVILSILNMSSLLGWEWELDGCGVSLLPSLPHPFSTALSLKISYFILLLLRTDFLRARQVYHLVYPSPIFNFERGFH